MKLKELLQNKPFFYKEIDYTRMPRAWSYIKNRLKPFKVIHVIGTNGKGSTGRFLAQILYANGKSVGHYTSPHIFDFNERFWINSKIASDEILEVAHERLSEILPDEFMVKTSYFEYATLLAAVAFEDCEYFVCEAGMGGELDATNVFEKELSLFTPIGLDHIDVLGNNMRAIANTKFSAMSPNANAILNDTMDKTCIQVALKIAKERGVGISFASDVLSDLDIKALDGYSVRFGLPDFLRSNLNLASAGAKTLLNKLDISNLSRLDIRGRCEKITDNLYIDVGHNELGARAIVQKFKGKRLTLIYNAFADKDFYSILSTLKPITKCVKIFNYKSHARELAGDGIKMALDELDMKFSEFQDSDMSEILNAKNDNIYLAFGSFYLVEAFLKKYDSYVQS